MRPRRVAAVVATLLVLCSQVGVGAGLAADVQDDRGVDSREEVAEFVDEQMAEDLREHDVSGATVAVVKEDELLFAEGYGYADRENRTPVDANRTLFRIGSVSKPFVWTAVMQGVEDGRLDRDADVNRYLDEVRVPDAYGEPVTLDHLATHTAGFEEQYSGTFAESPDDVRPLGETLRDVPARVRPPGEVTAYSNYGAALAGHVVARQSDAATFGEYAERNVFEPLEMENSTFAQPVPADLRANLSGGYRYEDGEFRRGEFETVGIPPAGSMSATATDMSKFMRAHLNEGRYGDSRVLSASAAREMHRQQFANHPELNGVTFGFYEQSRNGERIIGHGGDTELFHSGMWLFPERDLGVFVSYNSPGGAAAREEFFDSFTDRFFPAEDGSDAPPAVADGSGENPAMSAFEGTYRSTRVSYTSYEKVGALGADIRVRADGDALVTNNVGQEPSRWVRTGPTVFEEVNGDGRMAFRVEDGEVTYLFFDGAAIQSFERVAWWEATQVQLGAFAAALLLFASAVVVWPLLALRRAWKRCPPAAEGPRTARVLAGFAGLLGGGFLVAFAYVLLFEPNRFITDSAVLDLLLAVPAVVAVAALGAVALAALAWRDRYWGLLGRVHYTLLVAALVAFCLQLYYWNLLGGSL